MKQALIYEWSPLLETSGSVVTYWKLSLHLYRSQHTSARLEPLQVRFLIEDSGVQELEYVESQLMGAWNVLRLVQNLQY